METYDKDSEKGYRLSDGLKGNDDDQGVTALLNEPVMNDEPRAMVERMKALAKAMHNRDTKPRKYTNAPYITHPSKVVEMLNGWGYSADDYNDAISLAIAWGHDLFEDTKVTIGEVIAAAKCNLVVGGIEELTFKTNAHGAEKARQKMAYIEKIAKGAVPERLVVKIADRLCNTLDFCEAGDVWAKEYLKLGEPLFERIDACKGADAIKATLAQVRAKVAAPFVN